MFVYSRFLTVFIWFNCFFSFFFFLLFLFSAREEKVISGAKYKNLT